MRYSPSSRRPFSCIFTTISFYDPHPLLLSRSRVCIKIPATPESTIACQYLERLGIRTLSTCLFSVPQAIAATVIAILFFWMWAERRNSFQISAGRSTGSDLERFDGAEVRRRPRREVAREQADRPEKTIGQIVQGRNQRWQRDAKTKDT